MSSCSSSQNSGLNDYSKKTASKLCSQALQNEKKEPEKNPNNILFHSASFSHPSTQTNPFLFEIEESSLIPEEKIVSYLKPELRSTDNPRELFQNPKNRIDKFVPIDKIGLDYLASIGIISKIIIERIKNGEVEIEKHVKNVNDLFNIVLKNQI